MGNSNKWNRDENHESDKLTVVLFVSRNKDNKTLPNFTERRNAFTTTKEPAKLYGQFQAFVAQGQPGEKCRMYVSVNPRSNAKTFKALQHKLLDDEFNLSSLPQRVAALAAKKENAYDSKHLNWLFDFDPVKGKDTEELLKEFLADVEHYHKNTQTKHGEARPHMTVETHKTPNGYGVVVDQRFDTRELLTKWTNVELKRDDLLCVRWVENNQLTVDLENVQPSGPFTP
jgi:hypothetical protein